MSLLSNGATVLIAALLILAIAYRYYSAFLGAKVLALDPARATPAHTLSDGQNYHPTNKWVLFGHHFAAISGAGPLIGPVLAAQFGYLPGLLWILVGVCLAGAVQDFIVLTLSMRRNGRSLAQIAYSEINTSAGTAATIGILFVLVIALAGLGKVVTKALGGETVVYPTGTQFVARNQSPIIKGMVSGSVIPYHVPAGTRIVYPEHVEKITSTPIELRAEGTDGAARDIGDSALPRGLMLRVPQGVLVQRVDGDRATYPAWTEFCAPEGKLIQELVPEGATLPASTGLAWGLTSGPSVQDVYRYQVPAGTKIILPDRREPIITTAPFEISAGAMSVALIGPVARPELIVPLGGLVTREDNGAHFPSGTRFISATRPIAAMGLQGDVYRYRIPAGTQIAIGGPDEATGAPRGISTAATDFVLVVRPSDITVTQMNGYRLVAPAEVKVEEKIAGSTWGTFTIALTIPIAFMIGIYLYRIRKNRVLEASIIGGLLTLGAVYLGGMMNTDGSFLATFRDWFDLTGPEVGVAMAIYGFVAGVLPVWMLLCPRDYLSSFLKIGTVILLIVGVIVAHPPLRTPALNVAFLASGPVLGHAPLFPFVFITIMCGAISGFHALVASGTTPKMIGNERDARPIGYGAMLIEGLVGIVALIAAAAMPVAQYYDINVPAEKTPAYQQQIDQLAKNDRLANNLTDSDGALPDVGEHVQGRTGGAVTLALGMADILNGAVNNLIGRPDKPPTWLNSLFKYWYHFAIMFEALFILTTIDTGTRVGRFLLQETMGKWIAPALGRTSWWPAALFSTGLITLGWWYFLDANAFDAIWAMFGIANQMLAVIALAVASAALARSGRRQYLPVTVVPLCFVAITTTWAAVLKLTDYVQAIGHPDAAGHWPLNPMISALCVVAILLCAALVVGGAFRAIMRRPAIPQTVAA